MFYFVNGLIQLDAAFLGRLSPGILGLNTRPEAALLTIADCAE
jgi:hypothetical protein